jgi:hypothetical protein
MDTNLVLRDGSTHLTDDETLTSVKIGPMTNPLFLHVVCPEVSSGDNFTVELEFCTDALPTTEVYNMYMKQVTAAGHFCIPFFTLLEYLQVKINTANSTDDHGHTKIWIDTAYRYTKAAP